MNDHTHWTVASWKVAFGELAVVAATEEVKAHMAMGDERQADHFRRIILAILKEQDNARLIEGKA
jgi:hypothetical protein